MFLLKKKVEKKRKKIKAKVKSTKIYINTLIPYFNIRKNNSDSKESNKYCAEL